ncbi:hypothetical protein BKK49_03305 [Rodentibacter rarus]|uniref:Uncharacterized protein n=1 Tax=Rodentibacter rarus TaxID=1908260 RepID=A0A1V3IJ41_9PAST|nr:hypothetical protein [Rodentibacter rarus]OOF41288.1 hypothetical protein BKK50_08760 [Rodentibacter rarus]OOF42170.1 hypothetical protein BKK49_03305 [Rodentibacter rarus]
MKEIKFRAMRAAGIACFIVLIAIGVWVFTSSSGDIVNILTFAGRQVGGGTTYGVLLLAALPPFTGFLTYHVWKWIIK